MKKNLLFLLAIMVIVVASAFAIKGSDTEILEVMAAKNFVYDKYPDNSPGAVNDPLNYSLSASSGTAPLNCPNGANRCGVIAQDDGSGRPDLSQSYIIKTKN